MSRRFADPAWHAAIARLVASEEPKQVATALASAIGQVVEFDGTCLLLFNRAAPPEVLYHTLDPRAAKHYLERYIAGPYLLDPLYQLALRDDKPGICRFRDAAPDRFRSSEYYRQYCERTHLGDEMDYLIDAGGGNTLALVVGRFERRFSRADVTRLRAIERIVHAAMQRIWNGYEQGTGAASKRAQVHARLTECFDNFGAGVLTEREQQITQHLLRGYSTKAIARELEIAPGTVMVHKRNLFGKLGISSQYELFSRFIDALS